MVYYLLLVMTIFVGFRTSKNFPCGFGRNLIWICKGYVCIVFSFYWVLLWMLPLVIKGYLCYKIINSQNVSSEEQTKDFLILEKSYVWFSRYSKFYIFHHPVIYKICDIMSISTRDTVHFWTYFLNHNSLSHQTRPIDRYKQGQ